MHVVIIDCIEERGDLWDGSQEVPLDGGGWGLIGLGNLGVDR